MKNFVIIILISTFFCSCGVETFLVQNLSKDSIKVSVNQNCGNESNQKDSINYSDRIIEAKELKSMFKATNSYFKHKLATKKEESGYSFELPSGNTAVFYADCTYYNSIVVGSNNRDSVIFTKDSEMIISDTTKIVVESKLVFMNLHQTVKIK